MNQRMSSMEEKQMCLEYLNGTTVVELMKKNNMKAFGEFYSILNKHDVKKTTYYKKQESSANGETQTGHR